MKFTDEYFGEIKPGTVLINVDNTGELFNLTLAQYFVIKEPDNTTLQKELERYKQWVKDLQSGMYVNCVYCGHRYGPADRVPASMADVLKQHIEKCPEHPLSQYKRALNEVCADLACDDQCPHQEPDFELWPECENCPGHLGEIHQDTERDIKCWERYYLDKALADPEEQKKPEALTLDELRQMDGEPVWIQEGGAGHWELSADAADYLEDRDLDFYGMIACGGGLHQSGWLAYRHKSVIA